MTAEVWAALIAAAVAAGFIDSIAGGGGLVTVPALLLAGIPPAQALATNKVQGVFGAATAAISYARSGQVDPRRQIGAGLLAFAAGLAGALAVSAIPTQALRYILPVLLIGVALFFALKPGLGDLDRTERLRPALFTLTAVPLIAFYDGLLGPGAGAFYMIAFVTLAGHGILKATAHTKLLNFASNAGVAARFGVQDIVDIALPVERDRHPLVPGYRHEAHGAEQPVQHLGLGMGKLHEFEPVGAGRVGGADRGLRRVVRKRSHSEPPVQ